LTFTVKKVNELLINSNRAALLALNR